MLIQMGKNQILYYLFLSLKGSIQHFIESKIPISKGVINQINFNVTDQDSKAINVGKILLDLHIM